MSEENISDSSVKRTLILISGGMFILLIGLVFLARAIVY